MQLSLNFEKLAMLTTNEGSCYRCGQTTKRIIRFMNKKEHFVVTRYLCFDCLEIQEDLALLALRTPKPFGWRNMNLFVDHLGNVFVRGEYKPNLFGQHQPTDIKALMIERKRRKEERKLQKEQEIEEYRQKKEQFLQKQENTNNINHD
jgi:hypothetical protein